MYFLGDLQENRTIDPYAGFYHFALADKHVVKNKDIPKYLDKPYFWKINRVLPDRRGNQFCICEPLRPASDEELHMSYPLLEALNRDRYWSMGHKLLSQIGNIEEYIKADFNDDVIQFVDCSDEQYAENIKFIRRCIISKMAPLDKLAELMEQPSRFDFNRVRFYPTAMIPGIKKPEWVARKGFLVDQDAPASEYSLYYLINTLDRQTLALTKQEVYQYQDKFVVPMAISGLDNDNLLFMFDLSKPISLKPIRRSYCDGIVAVESKSHLEFDISTKYCKAHMDLFPGFEFVNDRVMPKEGTPFKIIDNPDHVEATPRTVIEVTFPSLEYNTYIQASKLFTMRQHCINYNISKCGDNLQNLRVIFDAKNPTSEKTSLF